MATRRDVMTRALERMGVIRMGSVIPGNIYTSVENALTDMLVELHESVHLDFDPLSDSSIPDERMPSLVNLFRYSPHLDALDTRMGPVERAALYQVSLIEFQQIVIGDADFIADEARDY